MPPKYTEPLDFCGAITRLTDWVGEWTWIVDSIQKSCKEIPDLLVCLFQLCLGHCSDVCLNESYRLFRHHLQIPIRKQEF